jgi:hypothetical protein
VKVPDVHHIHFTSIGVLISDIPSLASATATNERTRRNVEAVWRSALSFLNAAVKESGRHEGLDAFRSRHPKMETLEKPRRRRWVQGPQGRLRVTTPGAAAFRSSSFTETAEIDTSRSRAGWAARSYVRPRACSPWRRRRWSVRSA